MSNRFWQLFVLFILLTSCQSNGLHDQNFINNDIKLTNYINDKTPNLKLLPFEAKNAQKNIFKAVKYNPSIQALKQQLSLLKANKKGALALKENQVNFRGVGGIARQDEKNEIGGSASLTISRLLYDFGSTDQSVKSFDENIKSSEYSLIGRAEDLVLNGYQLWNNLYTQRKIISIYKEGIDQANPIINQIDDIAGSGLADKATILKAKKEYFELITEMKSTETLEKNISVQFFSFFNVKNSDQEVSSLKPFAVTNYRSLEKKMIKFSPFLKSQKFRINSLERNLASLKAKKKPNISLSSGLTTPFENVIADSSGSIGVTLNYVFNDGGQLDSQIETTNKQIKSEFKIYEVSVKELKQNLKSNYERYVVAMEARKALIDLIQISKEVRDTSKSQLVSGRSTLRDVLSAEVSVAKNQISLIQLEAQINSYTFIIRSLTSGLVPNVNWL